MSPQPLSKVTFKLVFCAMDNQMKKIRCQQLHDFGFIPFSQEHCGPGPLGHGAGGCSPACQGQEATASTASLAHCLAPDVSRFSQPDRRRLGLPSPAPRAQRPAFQAPSRNLLSSQPMPSSLPETQTPGFSQKHPLWRPEEAECTSTVPGQSCWAG